MAGTVERIAHYRILKRIGRGGMGVVYQAVDERDGKLVALKVIREVEGPGDEGAVHVREARVRFDREADILKSLLHVNVVTFYEIGEEDGTPYLAMEYLDGIPLVSFAGRPYTETLPLLVQAAHGLEYLSSRGIVHRDLSPDNILVIEHSGRQIVKLLDFGIAKMFETGSGLDSLTAAGFFLGKVAYGSPEQLGALGSDAVLDWRSDVYGLGIIFYQVLSGHRPFEGKVPVEYIAAHLNAVPVPVAAPAGMAPLPMDLVRLVGQMLEKRRERRPGSWKEIVDRLVGVLRQSGAGGSTAEIPPGPPPASPPTSRTELIGSALPPTDARTLRLAPASIGRGRVAAGVAVGLVALVAAAAVLVGRARLPRSAGAELPLRTFRFRRLAAKPAAAGSLQIFAVPYARVVSVSPVNGGSPAPVPADLTTPCVLDRLPAGTYRVVLSCPALDGRLAEREVVVQPGAATLLTEPFLAPSALAETMK